MPTEPNLKEVTREERIKSELAKLKRSEDAALEAQAAAAVDAQIAAEEEAAAQKAHEEANAKARAEEAKRKADGIKKLSTLVAKCMVDNQFEFPHQIPAHIVMELRAQAGL